MNKPFINLRLNLSVGFQMFCTLVLFLSSFATEAKTRRVLYIGNSYIASNNMPAIVDSIVAAMGDTIIYDQSVLGGYTLNQHSTNISTIGKIFSQPWDIVILQEQSQMPSWDPSQVAVEVYPYATRLDSMVKANDTCSQTLFLMTWGRASGDASNCPFYPPVCTFGGMQKRLRESYMQMAITNNALVAPVGMAFKVFKDSVYSPLLYTADSSHPSYAGSYLEALVLYSSIFHKKAINCSFVGSLIPPDAYRLRRISDKVVFDSLTLWQQNGDYPYAGFSKSVVGSTASFTNQSPVAAWHNWDFGDMVNDTASNPSHRYTASGSYLVTHTIYNNCFTETMTDSVTVSTTGIEANLEKDQITIANFGNGNISFIFKSNELNTVKLFDSRGILVREYQQQGTISFEGLAPGMYIYSILQGSAVSKTTGKLVVY